MGDVLRGDALREARRWAADPRASILTTDERALIEESLEEYRRTLSHQYVVQSEYHYAADTRNLPRSAALAVEALKLHASDESVRQVHKTLNLLPRRLARFTHDANITSVAAQPDGRRFATGDSSGRVRVWEIGNDSPIFEVRHVGPIERIRFAERSGLLLTASQDRAVIVWDAQTGSELARFDHDDAVVDVRLDPNERRVMTVTGMAGLGRSTVAEGTVHIWDLERRSALCHIEHNSFVAARFSPDGERVVSGGSGRNILIWESSTGRVVGHLAHQTEIRAFDVKWVENGMLVASHLTDGREGCVTLTLVEGENARPVGQLKAGPLSGGVILGRQEDWVAFVADETVDIVDLHTNCTVQKLPNTGSIVVSSNEQLLATMGFEGMRVWDRITGREIARVISETALDFAFSHNGQTMVTAGSGQYAFAWDLTHTLDPLLEIRTGAGARAAFSALGSILVTGGIPFRPGELLQAPKMSYILAAETGSWNILGGAYVSGVVSAFDVTPNGGYAAVASSGKTFIFEPSSQTDTFELSHENVTAVTFAGSTLVSLSYDGKARLWDCESRQEVASCSHGAQSHALACALSGEIFALGGDGTGVSVWLVPTAEEARRFAPRGPAPPQDGLLRLPSLRLCFSQDGRLLAIYDVDHQVWVYDVETGIVTARCEVEGWLRGISFSADSTRLALASSIPAQESDRKSGRVQILDTRSGDLVSERHFDQAATCVAFHPKDVSIVSGHADGWVCIWDATTGRNLVETRHRGALNTIAFSPDGRWLLSAAQDGIARVTMFRTEDLLVEADLRLPRVLTEAELHEFGP